MSLNEIIDATSVAVAADPVNAAVLFAVDGSLTTGVATTVRVRGHHIDVDEPPTLGGADAAANPVEYALAALISCQVVTYRFWAAKLSIQLDGISIRAEGDLDVRGFFGLDAEVRPGFGAVRLAVTLEGPETAERYRELRAAVDRHCPVLDLFANPTPVSVELHVGAPA